MASRKCEQCSASVPTDEQFCPNCGAFMDPLTPEDRSNVISVSSSGYERFELKDPPPEEPLPDPRPLRTTKDSIQCPSCGASNPANNRHCEECGARLSQAPLPTAPRPAVQATAGVRAALAISGLLFGVVIIALLFNLLGGDEDPSSTTVASTSSTAPVIEENGPLAVISTTCSADPVGSFVCPNLTSGTDDQYQVNWEDLQTEGGLLTIRLTFDQAMIVSSIQWAGISDPVKFTQNYRPRGLTISASDGLTDYSYELEDTPGLQTIPYVTLGANWIEFAVQSAYLATPTEGNVFKEIAIDEITVIGRPRQPDTTSNPDTTTTTAAS